jgi:hypothetical protein
MDLTRNGVHVCRTEPMPLGQIPTEQQPVAKRVYPPGNSRRERMNQIEAGWLELGIARPPT